jgi:hypothetical protein
LTEPTPFLKWAGGKRQLLKELIHHSPTKFNEYYEPFLGCGANKVQKVLHEREDQDGKKISVEAIGIAYWKKGIFKQDAPIMLKEEFGRIRRFYKLINRVLLHLFLQGFGTFGERNEKLVDCSSELRVTNKLADVP